MFGIAFDGHPHLVKLVLSEQFEGHPLRKDFALMTREAKPWPGAVEGEEEEDGVIAVLAQVGCRRSTSQSVRANFWVVARS